MHVKIEDYPEGHPVREQLEAAARRLSVARFTLPATPAPDDKLAKSPTKMNRPEQKTQIDCMTSAEDTPLLSMVPKDVDPLRIFSRKVCQFICEDFPRKNNRLLMLKDVIYHTPNGGKRTPVEGAILKGMGLRAGVYDIFMHVPTRTHAGLYLEAKRPGGTESEKQAAFADIAEGFGYSTGIFHSERTFSRAIRTYFCLPLFEEP